MRNKFLSLALLLVSVLGYNRVAFGWGTSGGDASRFTQLQETAVLFNNSGGTVTAGDAVVLDIDGSGVSTGTTLGAYIRKSDGRSVSQAKADSILAVGIAKTTCSDQRPCVIVTKGPALASACDSTDAVSFATAVGTAGSTCTAGLVGGGTNLGVALEPGDGTDAASMMIWIDPTGAD